MNRLVLIDGNAMMHRAYHALPPLTTPDGKPANMVYGFVSMVLRLHHALKPSHMAVAFDRPGPTFRNKLFADYQIQRPKAEDDFVSQIPMVHDTARAFGIPAYEADGFEADDVIGTIAKAVQHTGIDQVIIVTGDRDILQLVKDEKVMVYMPTKGLSEGKVYGEKDVVERMGVAPSLIPDFKALAGDPSDNYPGVPGIGPKTAVTLLNQFGSVEAVYKGIQGKKHTITDTIRIKLTAGKKSATLSHELATIRTDAPIKFNESSAHITTFDTAAAHEALEALHFPSLIRRLSGEMPPAQKKKQLAEKKKKEESDSHQQALF